MGASFIRQDWSPASERKPLTVSELDAWYASLVSRISNAVPRLEELCISDHHNYFYRGTKIHNVVTVQRESFKKFSEEHRFPSVLMD
jgi:hypothetical protein